MFCHLSRSPHNLGLHRNSMCCAEVEHVRTVSHIFSLETTKYIQSVGRSGTKWKYCITYISELYPCSTSDKQIVLHSKILDQMHPGDLILADKGFLLHDSLPQGVKCQYVPPFLTTQQFTPEQLLETTRIARARIQYMWSGLFKG